MRCAACGIVCCLMLLTACGKKQATKQTVTTKLDYSSISTETAKDSVFGYGDSLFIEGMISTGSHLICLNSGKDPLLFSISTDLLDTKALHFHRGNAGDEFIAPLLINGGEKDVFYVGDNGKKRITKVNAEDETLMGQFPLETTDALNDPSLLSPTQIAYLNFTPKAVQLCLYNIADKERTDTINLADGSEDGEYALGINGKYVIVAFLAEHKLIIAELSANKSCIERTRVLYGEKDGETDEKVYYSDVVCTDENIILLSQEMVNLATEEGHSTLEFLDYTGNVLRVVSLPFLADKMVKTTRGMFFTSPIDNSLHLVKIF